MNGEFTSAELDRESVIQACNGTIKHIMEHRSMLRERAIKRHMRPRKFFGIRVASSTREQAEEQLARGWDDGWFPAHLCYAETSLGVAESILALANACDARLIRVGRQDFNCITSFWPEAESRPTTTPDTLTVSE